MSKTAREVIAIWLWNAWGPAEPKDDPDLKEYLQADSILQALEDAGYKIMNEEEFAKSLDKGMKLKTRIERQSAAINKAKLKQLMED